MKSLGPDRVESGDDLVIGSFEQIEKKISRAAPPPQAETPKTFRLEGVSGQPSKVETTVGMIGSPKANFRSTRAGDPTENDHSSAQNLPFQGSFSDMGNGIVSDSAVFEVLP